MANEDYNNYIKSKEWFAVRELAFEYHGRACKKCGSVKQLHVHHKTYKNFKKEDIENDLIVLCRFCHKRLHKFCKKKNFDIWHGTIKYLETEDRLLSKVPVKIARKRKYRKNFNNPTGRVKGFNVRLPPEPKRPYIRLEDRVRKPVEPRPPKGRVDIEKFMQMYGLDEGTARHLLVNRR